MTSIEEALELFMSPAISRTLQVHPTYISQINECNRVNDGGNIDAQLADIIVQVAAFGDVIYG